MPSLHTIVPLLSTLTLASGTALHRSQGRSNGLQWGPCNLNTTLPVQCAKLAVPLDYTNKSCNKTLDLDVIKYPAQKGLSKGSIMLNFGGPGQDGLNSMIDYAPIQGPMTGGQHDLISWDPRGTGKTLLFSCWPGEPAWDALGSALPNSSDTATGRLWAEMTAVADKCYATLNQTGNLVGMAFTARDMMQIVDALGEDGLLRYWGISGGTTLGSTAAALFPDRIESVIIDGVMNVHQYYHGFEWEILAASDGAWEHFLAACVKNPATCPLARNKTVETLTRDMQNFLDTLKYNPISIGPYPLVIDYTIVKSYIFSNLYRPMSWPNVSIALDSLMTGDLETFGEVIGSAAAIPSQAQAVMGIRCGDKVPRVGTLKAMQPVFDQFLATSKWFGDWAWAQYDMVCAQWKFEAKERYLGDFHIKTKKPILLIGNPFDPVTPLISAQNMSSGFEGSVVLQHNGFGHTSLAHRSNCTDKIIANFFNDGVLPKPGTQCEPNVPLFAKVG